MFVLCAINQKKFFEIVRLSESCIMFGIQGKNIKKLILEILKRWSEMWGLT